MKKTEKKQFKELTEEELKEVTGGLVKGMPIAVVLDESELTCPDGRKVSSITQCDVHAALEVGVQGMRALVD